MIIVTDMVFMLSAVGSGMMLLNITVIDYRFMIALFFKSIIIIISTSVSDRFGILDNISTNLLVINLWKHRVSATVVYMVIFLAIRIFAFITSKSL